MTLKVSGIDGLHVCFFQNNWNVVERNVCAFLCHIMARSNLDGWLNKAILVLTLKKEVSESIQQFRSTDLCAGRIADNIIIVN